MLFQIVAQGFAYGHVYRSHYLVVAEFCFGLSFELGFGHFYRYDGGKTFAEVVAVEFHFLFFQLFEGFFCHRVVFGIFFKCARKSASETGQVRAALYRVDVVYVGVDVFVISRVVNHRYVHGGIVFVGGYVDDFVKKFFPCLVYEQHEFPQTVLGIECLAFEIPVLVFVAAVGKGEVYAGVEVCQFPQPVGKYVVVVFGNGKNALVGKECYCRAGFIGFTDYFHRFDGFAAVVFLHVNLALAADFGTQHGGEGVHARYAHAVQAAGHLVCSLVEFAAGVQYGHYHFQCRFPLFLVHVDGDAAAIVFDGYRIVFVDGYFYVFAIACQGLVYGVVHYFINQMVQALLAYVAYVHSGAYAHRFQTLQYGDVVRTVIACLCALLFFVHIFENISLPV